MKAEVWDKKSTINGVAAEDILKDSFFANARKIFLVRDSSDVVLRIESVDVIKQNNALQDKTDDEVIAWYIEDMKKPPVQENVADDVELALIDIYAQNDKILKMLEGTQNG